MPVYNWFKINETNDLRWMLIDRGRKWHSGAAKQAWEKVYSEYFEHFGINETYVKILNLRKEIALMKTDMALTKDGFLQNYIDMMEIDLKKLIDKPVMSKVNNTKVILEKYMGFRINERETSVKEYYTYLLSMSEESKAVNGK